MARRVALLAAATSLVAAAELGAQRFAALGERVRLEVEQGGAASLAVVAARGDEIVWEAAFGWADRERRIPATTHTMYSLASVSKPMTATGLMVLVERGLIDLDRPINDYLGASKLRARVGNANAASVRHVLDHTSGLPAYHNFFVPRGGGREPVLEAAIREHGLLVREAGQRFEYSNLGYGLIEHLVERVSARSFAHFMRDELFLPLGLEHTAVVEADAEALDLAVRHRADGRPLPFYRSDHGGGSAVFSCAHDLVRFAALHLGAGPADGRALLSPEAIRTMRRPSSRRPDGAGGYGLGWSLHLGPAGSTVVRHDGGMPGASASLILVPAWKVAVAVLAGSRSDLPQRVGREVLERMAPPWSSGRAASSGSARTASGRGPRPAPRRLRGVWEGTVEVEGRRVPIALRVRGGEPIRCRIAGRSEVPLRGEAFDGGYLTGWTVGRLDTEAADPPGRVLRFSLRLDGDRLLGAVTVHSRTDDGLPRAISHWAQLGLAFTARDAGLRRQRPEAAPGTGNQGR